MQIQKIPINQINPAPYNPRKDLQPKDPEYRKLLKSIDEFDCVEPLVWNRRSGHLVGGHQRFKILRARGDKHALCSVVDLSLKKEKALNLALNKISGDWDLDKLATLLDELVKIASFDIETTGFELPEATKIIDEILNNQNSDNFDIDEELSNITKPITRPGHIIELGKHRVICGDSKDEKVFQKLMDNKKAQLFFTDPPYAVDYRGGVARENKPDGNNWDNLSAKEYKRLLLSVLSNCYDFSDNKSALYLWFASSKIDIVIDALKATKWQRRNLIIWAKNTFAGSVFAQYKHKYEPCFYCFKKSKSPRWCGSKNETTIWNCDKPSKNDEHPTIKPLPLAIRAIRNSSYKNNIILDPFLGSGTTLIAAERMGRACYGIELEAKYCDVIVRRYIAAVGKDSVSKEILQHYCTEEVTE